MDLHSHIKTKLLFLHPYVSTQLISYCFSVPAVVPFSSFVPSLCLFIFSSLACVFLFLVRAKCVWPEE